MITRADALVILRMAFRLGEFEILGIVRSFMRGNLRMRELDSRKSDQLVGIKAEARALYMQLYPEQLICTFNARCNKVRSLKSYIFESGS